MVYLLIGYSAVEIDRLFFPPPITFTFYDKVRDLACYDNMVTSLIQCHTARIILLPFYLKRLLSQPNGRRSDPDHPSDVTMMTGNNHGLVV